MVTYLQMCAPLWLSPMLICLYFREIDRRGDRRDLRRVNLAIAGLLGLGFTVAAAGYVVQFGLKGNFSAGIFQLAMLGCLVGAIGLAIFSFIGHWRMFTKAMSGRMAWCFS
ncbi:MAG TPA: hypothetical protein PL151_11595 [Phycisphaerae bacterium]|nr:hypothetical protein [Phycisphaerae bacterium]HOJ73507.1 hypothetical protein [Phycisphaerae bacterium]HOM51685.1 hypothetical protein [Phycisphaerae bacterium]HON68189.1 hypothetical protein [Phycisphaerae bacterium]HOQ86282.1 hypothetical protein [Phycisphaerae bacterium]